MASGKSKEPLYCAAIDFGTTYTGLAFANWNEDDYRVIPWENNSMLGLETKAPTAILFNSELKFLAFGFEAVKQFARMENNQKRDCYYFEKFKMNLHQLQV